MPELEVESQEAQQVRGWRFDHFFKAGFTVGEARRLSQAGADYHEAEKLLEQGCPVRVAYRILRGL